jgi:hypothetical protein
MIKSVQNEAVRLFWLTSQGLDRDPAATARWFTSRMIDTPEDRPHSTNVPPGDSSS